LTAAYRSSLARGRPAADRSDHRDGRARMAERGADVAP
jgi:hypothetical protein